MKKVLTMVVVLALLVAGFVLFRGDPDERAIRKAFQALVERSQWEDRDDIVRAGYAARVVVGHCTKDIFFKVNDLPHTLRNRGDLQLAIVHARTSVDHCSLQIMDSEIELGPERKSALMFATGRITIGHLGEKISELRSVKLTWENDEEDGWLLARVEPYETIDGS